MNTGPTAAPSSASIAAVTTCDLPPANNPSSATACAATGTVKVARGNLSNSGPVTVTPTIPATPKTDSMPSIQAGEKPDTSSRKSTMYVKPANAPVTETAVVAITMPYRRRSGVTPNRRTTAHRSPARVRLVRTGPPRPAPSPPRTAPVRRP